MEHFTSDYNDHRSDTLKFFRKYETERVSRILLYNNEEFVI